jgi:hypothetical protein
MKSSEEEVGCAILVLYGRRRGRRKLLNRIIEVCDQFRSDFSGAKCQGVIIGTRRYIRCG